MTLAYELELKRLSADNLILVSGQQQCIGKAWHCCVLQGVLDSLAEGPKAGSDATDVRQKGFVVCLWGFRTRPLPLTWSSMRPAHTR
jgi:hypothetical protein